MKNKVKANYLKEKFNADVTTEQAKELCDYFGIYFYDTEDMKEELQDDLRIDGYIMEFVDVKALAEDNRYEEVDDGFFVDLNTVEEFERQLKVYYNGSIKEAIEEM